MTRDHSHQNLQKTNFRNEDLKHVLFNGSDLRGTDFSGADLSEAIFVNVRTGIAPTNMVLIFSGALIVAAFSCFIAMLAGNNIQAMLASTDWQIKLMGLATILVMVLFIGFTYWKGGRMAMMQLIIPVFFFSIIAGSLNYFTGVGTGKGMFYELVTFLFIIAMFVVGSVVRIVAGPLSNILFLIMALMGSVFGKTAGGSIATVVMAISCALISNRALSKASGFEMTRKIAALMIAKLGTSFRNCKMIRVDFSHSKSVRNADFSNADIFLIHWGDCQKINCIM